jgi:hypothetical protein
LQVEAAAQQISRELEQATQQPAAAADASAPQQQQQQQQQGSSQSIKLFVGVNKPGAAAGGDASHGTPGRGSRPSSAGGAASKGSIHSSSSSSPLQQKKKDQQQAGSTKAGAAAAAGNKQQQQGDGDESASSSRRSSSVTGGAAAAADEDEAEQSLVSVKIVVDNFVPVMSRVSCRCRVTCYSTSHSITTASIKAAQAELLQAIGHCCLRCTPYSAYTCSRLLFFV